jgi:hypothetical protein
MDEGAAGKRLGHAAMQVQKSDALMMGYYLHLV